MSQYTCIICPNSCRVTVIGNNEVFTVSGNQCRRGEEFAIHEHTGPMRMFTSTVRINGAAIPRISVISSREIPKEKVKDCQKVLSEIVLQAPVRCGETVMEDIEGTGADMLASRTLEPE